MPESVNIQPDIGKKIPNKRRRFGEGSKTPGKTERWIGFVERAMSPDSQSAAPGTEFFRIGDWTVEAALNQLSTGLTQAAAGSRKIADGQELLGSKLGELADGTDKIAGRTTKRR